MSFLSFNIGCICVVVAVKCLRLSPLLAKCHQIIGIIPSVDAHKKIYFGNTVSCYMEQDLLEQFHHDLVSFLLSDFHLYSLLLKFSIFWMKLKN